MYTQYLFRFSFSHVRVTFENLFSFPCPVSFPKSLFTVPFSYSLLQFIFERSLLYETLFKPNFILIFCFQLPSSNPRCQKAYSNISALDCIGFCTESTFCEHMFNFFFKLENMDVCLGNSLLIDVQESILQKILPLQSKSNIATCEDFL